MTTPPPIRVVSTITDAFFRYRGLVAASPGLGPGPVPVFTDDRIISDMEQFGLVRIDATRRHPRGRRDWVVFFVLSARGKYSHHSPDLRKLLRGVETERPAKEGRLDELIVVAEEDFFSRKHLTELIDEMRAQDLDARRQQAGRLEAGLLEARSAGRAEEAAAAEAARRSLVYGDRNGEAPFHSAHYYHNFALVVPEHKSVPAHIVLPADTAAALLEQLRLDRTSLSIIRVGDPPAIWADAREGQIVLIVRDSRTAAVALNFRRVER